MYGLGECMYHTLCYPRQDALRAATPFSHPSVVTDLSTRRRGFRPPSGERTTLTKSRLSTIGRIILSNALVGMPVGCLGHPLLFLWDWAVHRSMVGRTPVSRVVQPKAGSTKGRNGAPFESTHERDRWGIRSHRSCEPIPELRWKIEPENKRRR